MLPSLFSTIGIPYPNSMIQHIVESFLGGLILLGIMLVFIFILIVADAIGTKPPKE